MSSKIRMRQAVGALVSIGRRAQPGTLTVLMYHAVTAQPVEDSGQMSTSAAGFDAQMAELADAGVDVVDLKHGVETLAAGRLPRPAAAVVFDDGFVGVHDHAAEILSRRGWPATVFVTTSWIGSPAMPLAEANLGRPLTWAELAALTGAGMTIGSHTVTHPRLSQVADAELRDELHASREEIADRLGARPDTFAYPFGAYDSFDDRTRRAVADEGFGVACTTVFGRNAAGQDPLAVRRIRVSWCDGPGEITKMIAGAYDWYALVQRAQTI